MVKKYTTKHLKVDDDFLEYIDRFIQILHLDKEMLSSIPIDIKEKVMKNGLFSHGVRELIRSYVDINWKDYIKEIKKDAGDNNP